MSSHTYNIYYFITRHQIRLVLELDLVSHLIINFLSFNQNKNDIVRLPNKNQVSKSHLVRQVKQTALRKLRPLRRQIDGRQ